jgi:aldose 1-epimerase
VFHRRIWKAERIKENAITFYLHSPQGDQGFPGEADIRVTYTLDAPKTLKVTYDAVADQDTVFNMTSHSYFNLAGHQHTDKALSQELILPGRTFNPDDVENIPTGEVRPVAGTPMDFRTPKAIGRDIGEDYFALKLQNGYDHNFEVYTNPCAVLTDPVSGRTMSVETDCCGVQFYCGNFLEGEKGKDGVCYCFRGGVCLETQFYPDAVNHPEWKQPFVKAGTPYHSETKYIFG